MKKVLLFLFFLNACSLIRAQFSEHIHIDQFGYLPNSLKIAVLSNPEIGFNSAFEYEPSSTLEIRRSSDDQVVFTGSPQQWNTGQVHEGSGDRGWWFDFSSLSTEGEYYIIDPLQQEQTGFFRIADDVYEEVMKAAGRMFYYNRCNAPKESTYAGNQWSDGDNFNNPLQDYECRFIFDAQNEALEKDLSGGWFDAGDYNKYVTFAHSAVHNLLWSYQENPDAFGDNWNIPESGNGIPDILDEVKWELDWLLKMNNEDGSTHIKMGSSTFSDNALAPPSLNTDPRFYGPTCSSASIAVASMFAHAAMVFEDFNSLSNYSELLFDRAIASWNYVLPQIVNGELDFACDNGEIVAGDADWDESTQREKALVAAAHLFELTGEASYSNYLVNYLTNAEPVANNFWAGYKTALNDALLMYAANPESNVSSSQEIFGSFEFDIENNWNGYYGFNEEDLYRAFMPEWSYHWGSNSPKAAYGVLNLMVNSYELFESNSADYSNKALDQLHYFHGVNPLGMVHLSNMNDLGAEKSVNEIYHTWFSEGTSWDNAETSLFGPAPGFLTGGPNPGFSVTSISPPSGQPRQKSYLDWNTGWPDRSWEISEPAIYYQANYIRLLAHLVNLNDVVSDIEELSNSSDAFKIYPNPSNALIEISDPSKNPVSVYNELGQIQNNWSILNAQVLDISKLDPGIYILRKGKNYGKFLKF
ncbi:MAG: glycoside hydrolase family 9 protein [Bacteroidota bacterium]